MTRYVKTVSASGESTGGSGLTAADVCNTICTLLPKYVGQVGLTTTLMGRSARNCLDVDCTAESITPCNTTNYPGTDSGLQYATASAGDHMGNWYPLAVCNCWTCCYDGCICLEYEFPSHCYDAFIMRWNGIKICRCCYFNYNFSFGTDSCYSRGANWSSGDGCNQYFYCVIDPSVTCNWVNKTSTQYQPPGTGWQNYCGKCHSHQCCRYYAMWIPGSEFGSQGSCYSCCGHRTINLEWQFWRYNNHMSGQAREETDRYCDSQLADDSDGKKYLCEPDNEQMCTNEFWVKHRMNYWCCSWAGWKETNFKARYYCWCSCGGYGVCWNDCCGKCTGRQFSKFIFWPCCCLLPHLTSYCCDDQHINHHTSWCIMALHKCVPGYEGATPTGDAI